jgi:glycosyltransferase involved in cell wall biosynthesis
MFAELFAKVHQIHMTDWDADFSRLRDYLSWRYVTNAFPRRWSDRGIIVHHIPRISPAVFSPRLRQLNEVLFQRHLERIIRDYGIEVVIGSFVTSPPRASRLILDVFDDNIAYWNEYSVHKSYATDIADHERHWARVSHKVVAVSSVLRDRLYSRYHIVPERMEIVPNGVRLDVYRPAPDQRAVQQSLGLDPRLTYVGNIGSLNRRPEAVRILEVAKRLKSYPHIRILLVGAGREIPFIRQQAQTLKLSNVLMAGFYEGETLIRYFQAIRIGLCPYHLTEGLRAASPLRLLHYSAAGAIVVSTAADEVVRMGLSNVVFAPDDDSAFADTVVRALDVTPHVPTGIAAYDLQRLATRYLSLLG